MGDNSDERNDSDLDWYQPLGLMRPWLKSAWFRGLLFLILFAPVVVVVWLGHSTAWLVVFAALGLAMSIYNEALNDIGFFTRSAWRSNENGYEQTELMRIFGFLFGAGLYVTTLVFAISLYRHH